MAPRLTATNASKTASAQRPIGRIQHPDCISGSSSRSSSKWYFSREEIEKRSPSRLDGIDLKVEKHFRRSYCMFLQELGKRLGVPPPKIATAMVFCHRFYARQSHSKNDRYAVATSCMFLAGKAEDHPIPLQYIVRKSYEIRHGEPAADLRKRTKMHKDVYLKQKELVLVGERLVLVTLGFDLDIDHPYKPLVAAVKWFNITQKGLPQVAWNFVKDTLLTSLCLQFKAHQIAAGAILLASKFLKVELPKEVEVWWQELKVTPRQLDDICDQILELYEPARDSGVVYSADLYQRILVQVCDNLVR